MTQTYAHATPPTEFKVVPLGRGNCFNMGAIGARLGFADRKRLRSSGLLGLPYFHFRWRLCRCSNLHRELLVDQIVKILPKIGSKIHPSLAITRKNFSRSQIPKWKKEFYFSHFSGASYLTYSVAID